MRVSSIVTSSKVLSTQPASINSLSVPSTICNPFRLPTQWSWWITVVSTSIRIYKISSNLGKFCFIYIFSILRMQLAECAVNFYHHTPRITTLSNFSSPPWNIASDVTVITSALLWTSYLRPRFTAPLPKRSATSLNKILLDGIGIVVMFNSFYLWCTGKTLVWSHLCCRFDNCRCVFSFSTLWSFLVCKYLSVDVIPDVVCSFLVLLCKKICLRACVWVLLSDASLHLSLHLSLHTCLSLWPSLAGIIIVYSMVYLSYNRKLYL